MQKLFLGKTDILFRNASEKWGQINYLGKGLNSWKTLEQRMWLALQEIWESSQRQSYSFTAGTTSQSKLQENLYLGCKESGSERRLMWFLLTTSKKEKRKKKYMQDVEILTNARMHAVWLEEDCRHFLCLHCSRWHSLRFEANERDMQYSFFLSHPHPPPPHLLNPFLSPCPYCVSSGTAKKKISVFFTQLSQCTKIFSLSSHLFKTVMLYASFFSVRSCSKLTKINGQILTTVSFVLRWHVYSVNQARVWACSHVHSHIKCA